MAASKLFPVILIPFLVAGCFRTRADIAREKEESEVRSTLQQSMVEHGEGLEKLHQEIGRLQGRIEELEHQRSKEMTGLTASRDSADKSMEQLRERLDKMAAAQDDLFEEVKKLKEENFQLAKAQAERPKAVVAAGKKTPSFEDAMAAHKAKNYEAAAEAFRAYLQKSPKGKKSLDARYYLGDSLYHSKDYAKAIVELGVVHEKSLKSPLGRKATLRIAESFRALGKDKDAKAFAQILSESSPGSEEAKQARKFLK